MSLTIFHSFLLQTFASNLQMGSGAAAIRRRNQTLAVIYANFFSFFICVMFDLGNLISGMEYKNVTFRSGPFLILSIISLKIGNQDLAVIFTLIACHIGNTFTGHSCQASLAAGSLIFAFPNFSLFMSPSLKIHTANTIMCFFQSIGQIMEIRRAFNKTLTEEQDREIYQYIAIIVVSGCILCPLSLFQKALENNLWKRVDADHEKAEEVAQEVMQAVEAKEAFISSLSHEIRNPLNSMSGSISYLLEVVKEPQQRQILNNAKLSGETLLNLINNLLDTAKLKSDKMELSYSETNVTDIFKKVLAITSENLSNKKIFVDVYIDSLIPKVIWSDASRLLQIILNLMSNSIKFTPEGKKIMIFASWCSHKESSEQLLTPINILETHNYSSNSRLNRSMNDGLDSARTCESLDTEEFEPEEAEQRIKNLLIKGFRSMIPGYYKNVRDFDQDRHATYAFHRVQSCSANTSILLNRSCPAIENPTIPTRRGYLKVQISDTGCGIAQGDIPKLFQMFTQANRSISTSYGGTGLGLWICKQLCQKMGGEISLTSELNNGTNFIFYVPIDNNSLPQFTNMAQIDSGKPSDRVVSLVVDDYQYNRDLHRLLLEREGVQVVLASDGEEAVKIYTDHYKKIDFIMMDIQMPKMNGFMAAKNIREFELANGLKAVDIYFVSGEYYNEQEIMASFKMNNRGVETSGMKCLRKPVDMGTIKRISEKYLKKKK